jgi:CheY-like chemotaxis protein
MMPVMDGYEATRKIRASGYKKVPIIALTALTKEADIKEAKGAGFDFHIGKPTEKEPLLKALERYLL